MLNHISGITKFLTYVTATVSTAGCLTAPKLHSWEFVLSAYGAHQCLYTFTLHWEQSPYWEKVFCLRNQEHIKVICSDR